MILKLDNVLSQADLQALRQIADSANFVDGKLSNPHNTAKNNNILDHTQTAYGQSAQILQKALLSNELFRNFALPNRICPPLLCKYGEGKFYGEHSDSAYIRLAQQAPLRSDVSATVFVSSADSYEGGELVIHLENESVKIKMDAGCAVVYPSTCLHEVLPVISGERVVAITFVESQVKDESKRNIMFNLAEVYAEEGLKIAEKNRVRLEFMRQNLLRMWS